MHDGAERRGLVRQDRQEHDDGSSSSSHRVCIASQLRDQSPYRRRFCGSTTPPAF